MALDLLDRSIFAQISQLAEQLEGLFEADVLFYSGPIHPALFRQFRDYVENIKQSNDEQDTLAFFVRTGGGSAETAERMVSVLRHYYSEVHFVVPDIAMSAGTILCMSGDKIYMDYSSSLGPIDPQVQDPSSGEFVPALGYLDKVKELTDKSELSNADMIMLNGMDLGRLAVFEQARDLSIDLLKKWLVEYKFRNWSTHRTTKPGQPVTDAEKHKRAEEIATALTNHHRWRSHGRHLDIRKLAELRIEIDDYSGDNRLAKPIRDFNDTLTGYIDRNGLPFFTYNHRIGL